MDLNDYVIAQEGKDWRAMLAGWQDFLPPSYTLWFVNRLVTCSSCWTKARCIF